MSILCIALPVPLRRTFDYAAGDIQLDSLKPGMRILVPFGRQKRRVGVLLKIKSQTDINPEKIKKIVSAVDSEPVLSKSDLKLLQWTADYYQHPIGEVIFNALPATLRSDKSADRKGSYAWSLTESGRTVDPATLKRAPRQLALLKMLASQSKSMSSKEINSQFLHARTPLQALHEKGLVVREDISGSFTSRQKSRISIVLNEEQSAVLGRINQSLDCNQVFLLDGVTGCGKTEVYIEAMKSVIESGKQVLILSPEIGLTPQLIERIASRVDANIAVLHSGLSDTERFNAWLDARNGDADIIIGTRSAIWTSLRNPGLFIVDEEHDLSFKQQDGLKYSARDIAVIRANFSGSPVILGSATPSMESLHNVNLGKFQLLKLNKRAGNASEPLVSIVDLRNRAMRGAVSEVMLAAVKKELANQNQVLLFLNRRGYSPTIMCHHCAWLAHCPRCDMHMTYHKQRNTLICHHCDRNQTMPVDCPDCGASNFIEIGHGTERLLETISESFPEARILRIDRDSTRRKGSMETMLNAIKENKVDILIGTQMLAKGHHFPSLTMVGIIDADSGLCSSDFRASERMAQLFVQVSGRAGREKTAGKVLLQTHFPDHLLLNSLINDGYREFAKKLLLERKQTNLPPFSYLALLRTEGHQRESQRQFLYQAASLFRDSGAQIQIYGPIPAPIEKRAGKLRMQLLLMSDNRSALRRAMHSCCPAVEKLPDAKKVRWSLDIDPQDMM